MAKSSRFAVCATAKLVSLKPIEIGVMSWILLGRCVVSNVEVFCVCEKLTMEAIYQSTTLMNMASVVFAGRRNVAIQTMSITELVQQGHAMSVM